MGKDGQKQTTRRHLKKNKKKTKNDCSNTLTEVFVRSVGTLDDHITSGRGGQAKAVTAIKQIVSIVGAVSVYSLVDWVWRVVSMHQRHRSIVE